MARALKVYRTPIGFHDAYVAAPTQKAALAAWGSDANLFARGLVEEVTEPALTAEPLAKPGVVVKRLRGSAQEHFDALPKAATKASVAKPAARAKARARPPAPRPSRKALDAAEQAMAAADARHAKTEAALRKREEALRSERRALEEEQARERDRLADAAAQAQERYDAALTKWRDRAD